MSDFAQRLSDVAEMVRKHLVKHVLSKRFQLHEAEDIVQDGFVRAFQNVAKGEVDVRNLADAEQLRFYLFRTVNFVMLERFRLRKKTEAVDVSELEMAGDVGAGLRKTKREQAEDGLLDEVIGQLSQDEASLLQGWIEGETAKEAAERLKISVGAAKMRLSRLRAKIDELVVNSKHLSRLKDVIALSEERWRNE